MPPTTRCFPAGLENDYVMLLCYMAEDYMTTSRLYTSQTGAYEVRSQYKALFDAV